MADEYGSMVAARQRHRDSATGRLRCVVRDLLGLTSHLDGLLSETRSLSPADADALRDELSGWVARLDEIARPLEAESPRLRPHRRGLGGTPPAVEAVRDKIAALPADEREAVRERAAIQQADGGLPPFEAESAALEAHQQATQAASMAGKGGLS